MRLLRALLEAIQDLELTKLDDPDEDILLAALEHHQVKLRYCGKMLATIMKLDKSAILQQTLQFVWYDSKTKKLYVISTVRDLRTARDPGSRFGDYVVMRVHSPDMHSGKHGTVAELHAVLDAKDSMLDLGSPKISAHTGVRVSNNMNEVRHCLEVMAEKKYAEHQVDMERGK